MVEKELANFWRINKSLIACNGTNFGDLEVVGKKDDKLQLARRIYSEGEGKLTVIEEYLPKNIILSQTGGCVEQVKSERVITTISEDEYWNRCKVNEIKQKYIDILKGL